MICQPCLAAHVISRHCMRSGRFFRSQSRKASRIMSGIGPPSSPLPRALGTFPSSFSSCDDEFALFAAWRGPLEALNPELLHVLVGAHLGECLQVDPPVVSVLISGVMVLGVIEDKHLLLGCGAALGAIILMLELAEPVYRWL